jgi:hypothetical protein
VTLNSDAPLSLKIHGIEELRFHITHFDGTRHFENTVGQSRLTVVDVGDDAEIAGMVEISHKLQERAKITHLGKSSTLFLEKKGSFRKNVYKCLL